MGICQSCGKSYSGGVCQHCGYNPQALNIAQQVSTAKAKVPCELDIAILIDRTASSDQFSRGIKGAVALLLNLLSSKCAAVKVWLHTYGDEDFGQQPETLCAGTSVQEADEAIKRLTFGGGGDPEETHHEGLLYALRQTNWNTGPLVRRAIVWFMTNKPKPLKNGVTPKQIGEECAQKDIALVVVSDMPDFYQEIVEAANGTFAEYLFSISNDPTPAEWQKVVHRVAASVSRTASAEDDATLPLGQSGPSTL